MNNGQHIWIKCTKCTNTSYWVYLCSGKNTSNRRGCIVRYQLFPVSVMISLQHRSSGSTAFNNHLLIRKFLLCTTLQFLFQSMPFPASLSVRSWRWPMQLALRKGQQQQSSALRSFVSVSLQMQVPPASWVCYWTLHSQQWFSYGLCYWGLPFWERVIAKGFFLGLCSNHKFDFFSANFPRNKTPLICCFQEPWNSHRKVIKSFPPHRFGVDRGQNYIQTVWSPVALWSVGSSYLNNQLGYTLLHHSFRLQEVQTVPVAVFTRNYSRNRILSS